MNGRRLGTIVAAALALAGCDNGADPGVQGWIEAEMLFVGPDEPGRIETLAVREGDKVSVGAPLFTVDAELQQAEVMQVSATVSNMQRNLERARELLRSKTGTEKAYDDAQQALREAEARLNSA